MTAKAPAAREELTMDAARPNRKRMGITLRTALLSWLVTIVTLLIFVTVIIPEQKRIFFENLDSKAHGVTVSLRDVAAGAVVIEDYSAVVDHCMQMLNGDPSLDYLIVTRNDGFSMIHERTGWRSETDTPDAWRPAARKTRRGIGLDPLLGRRVFYYSKPFDYSGIQWGWIHVALSLEGYDRSVSGVYQRTGLLAILCILLSLGASLIHAKRLVKPILSLQAVVQQVAGGDLSSRASVESGDEIGNLAHSVNQMTEALLHRDRILQSVRFAAQQFLGTTHWETVIEPVLGRIGQAAHVSRILIFENQIGPEGSVEAHMCFEWLAEGMAPTIDCPMRQSFSWDDSGLGPRTMGIEGFEIRKGQVREQPAEARRLLEPWGVKSFLWIPVVVANSWWGVFCLEECVRERDWTDAELDSLRAAADMLGATIERHQTQEALLAAKDAAETASLAKSQFLANMSHEIRTPITGVIGMLQLLHKMDLGRKQGRYVANALFSAEALMNVIGDVLDFSKIEAGKMELEEETFRVADIVDGTVRMFAETAERKGVELAYNLDGSLPELLVGDPNRLRQVLVNLVGNAVKFTDNGEIIVTCTSVSASPDETVLRFEVRDTGCGISQEQQALVFDAFSQADNSMSRFHGGTGLGLAISRQLSELMGGTIGVESEHGQGASFWFTVACKACPEDPSARSSGLLDLRALKVLVVEDCARTREIYREYIQSWGGRVEVAANGAEGIEKLRRAAEAGEPFVVSVLDWRMPEMNGISMAREVKADALLKGTSLVLMGSFTQTAETEELKAAGFSVCVPKPLSRSDLYDAIVTAANGDLERIRRSSPKHGASSAQMVSAASGTILLAEDNEINREVATEMILELGYRCRCVRTGREAVEAIREGDEIDLVLMDCQMPEMDGYQATRLIRQWEASETTRPRGGRKIPIVALTAHATKSDRERCLAAGMDDYLTKPLDANQLARTLRKWIEVDDPPRNEGVMPVAPSAATESKSEIIDYPSLLDRCRGNDDLAEKLIRMFVENTRENLRKLETSLAAADAATTAEVAHSIKGASGSVSATPLWEVAAQLETMGRENTLSNGPDLVRKMHEYVQRLSEEIDGNGNVPRSPKQEEESVGRRDILGARILLVEDNPVNQIVTQQSLRSVGLHVDVATNGQEALDALSSATAPYDLVLMDCQMPIMDGFTATRLIREQEAQVQGGSSGPCQPGRIPIIGLTSLTMPEDREQGLASGMDDYVAKPFELNALMAVIKRWLPPSPSPTHR